MKAAAAGTPPPVLVVMGVTGTGKSTVAAMLTEHLGWELREGDALHPAENIAKMAAGTPLTDADRWPWLDQIAGWIEELAAEDAPGIVTCSALKRSYRDRLRRPNVTFVHLAGDRVTLVARLATRRGHFMPPSLLDSQLATLEVPGPDENVITIGLSDSTAQEVTEILSKLGRPEPPYGVFPTPAPPG